MTSANHAASAAARVEAFTPAITDRHWHDDAMANLCAHALVASTQGAAACNEFAEIFETRGEHAATALFRQLAVAEAERAAEVVRAVGHRPLLQGPAWQHYSWLYQDSPNRDARKLVARLMTPPLALRIALEAGERVRTQYERLSASADRADVRSHARELAAEKAGQMELINDALAATDSGGDELMFAMP